MSITGIRNRFLKNIAATLAAILVINPVVSLGADLALLDSAVHVEAAGDLSLISGSDQAYQAAELNSGADLGLIRPR